MYQSLTGFNPQTRILTRGSHKWLITEPSSKHPPPARLLPPPGLFGVLYTVAKEKERSSWIFVGFKLLFDVLQLLLLTVKPSYGWDIGADTK